MYTSLCGVKIEELKLFLLDSLIYNKMKKNLYFMLLLITVKHKLFFFEFVQLLTLFIHSTLHFFNSLKYQCSTKES